MLTEAQVIALEKAKTEKEAHGEFESEHPGYCGAQDTFYVGNLKGVGRIYQQTFIDTYTKVGFGSVQNLSHIGSGDGATNPTRQKCNNEWLQKNKSATKRRQKQHRTDGLAAPINADHRPRTNFELELTSLKK